MKTSEKNESKRESLAGDGKDYKLGFSDGRTVGRKEVQQVAEETIKALNAEIEAFKSKPDFFEDFKAIQAKIQTIKKTSTGEIDSRSYKFADWEEGLLNI